MLDTLWIGICKISPRQTSLTEENILKCQNWAKKSSVTFDGPDGWAKRWISSNLDMIVAKRKQQEGGCVMICNEIVNQTIFEPFEVDKRDKMNRANYCDFMDKTFFAL